MSRRASLILCLGAPTAALGLAAYRSGGGGPLDWNVSLLILGLAGLACSVRAWRHESLPRLERVCLWAALLFPTYVAFQLVPLPVWLLRLVSPTRAEVAGALGSVMPAPGFAPLSIAPGETWAHLSRIVGYALVFLFVRYAATRSTASPWVLTVPLLAIGGSEAASGLLQYSSGTTPISGTYVNRNHFAGLLEMVLPFALLGTVAVVDRGKKQGVLSASAAIGASLLLALAGAIFLAIGLSVSKMGMLSTLGSLVFVGALVLKSGRSVGAKWPAFAALSVLAVVVLVFFTPTELVERFGGIASEEPTEGRLPIWKDGFRLFAAYPLFGSGLHTFYPGILPYQTSGIDLAWPEAHNDYVQLLCELGIVGFLIPALLMSGVFARATKIALSGGSRETRLFGLACSGGLAAIIIHSIGDFNLYVPANAMVLAWISGLSSGLPDPVDGRPYPERAGGNVSLIWKAALALGCLATVYSSASLMFLHSFHDDPKSERVFCHFGICDTDAALAALQRQHGATTVAAVPVAALLNLMPRDAAGSYRWCDLGAAMLKAGRIAEARYCFSRGLALAPRMPSAISRAADFHFDLGENQQGLELMARALQADPTYGQAVFGDYEQRRIGVDEILRFGLPDDPRVTQSYFRYQIEENPAPEHAKIIWSWMVTHHHVDDPLAREYVGFLMGNGTPEAAWQAWILYAAGRSSGYPESNRVFNGDFERASSGVVFDWRMGNLNDDVEVALDAMVVRSGRQSLRVRFNGKENVDYVQTSETTFVTPGIYRFQAFVRTQGITTDQGIRFCISDGSPLVNVKTDAVVGTNDWKSVEQIVVVPTEPRLLTIRLVRQKSLKFDSNIAGTAWIDDVSLRKIE